MVNIVYVLGTVVIRSLLMKLIQKEILMTMDRYIYKMVIVWCFYSKKKIKVISN